MKIALFIALLVAAFYIPKGNFGTGIIKTEGVDYFLICEIFLSFKVSNVVNRINHPLTIC